MRSPVKIFVALNVVVFGIMLYSFAHAKEPLEVTVSIVPQKYFVEAIGGELVNVTVMVPPGASPERYEPRPRQMVALVGSRIYFAIGVPFEDVWLERILDTNPDVLVVHTDAGIEKRSMGPHSHFEDDGKHGSRRDEAASHGHSHGGGKDPHIWLSPPLVMQQARNILEAFLRADPAHKDIYEANYGKFITRLADLDAEIKGILREKNGETRFMVFHPAWGYFADAYGLSQIAVELEGKEPRAQDLRRCIELARRIGIKVIFVQPQFSTRSAQTIADAIGGRIAFADPLAEDWAVNLRNVAREIAAGF